MIEATLFDVPSAPVTAETRQILALMGGDPIHSRDREAIITAILYCANRSGGVVDPNMVRARLCNDQGALTVYPRLMGAVYHALVQAGVLTAAGWILNEDTHGRNAGRPMRRYRRRGSVGTSAPSAALVVGLHCRRSANEG